MYFKCKRRGSFCPPSPSRTKLPPFILIHLCWGLVLHRVCATAAQGGTDLPLGSPLGFARPFSPELGEGAPSSVPPAGLRHTIPYHTIPYHTIPYHTIPCHTIPYHTIPYHTIPYHTIPYHPIPSHPIPSHPIPYHTTPHNAAGVCLLQTASHLHRCRETALSR